MFQFAVEVVAATSLKGENQILNLFSKWYRWSEMTIKASECHLFGICKKGTTSTQYKPKLYLDNTLVPPANVDDCFTYLGSHFDFKMSDNKHKSELIETITGQIEIIDKLPFHPNKSSYHNIQEIHKSTRILIFNTISSFQRVKHQSTFVHQM